MRFVVENLPSAALLSVNLLVTVSYFFLFSKPKIKTAFFRLPMILQKIYVVLFVAPLFLAPFVPQTRFMERSLAVILSGIPFAAAGLSLIVMSFFRIGVVPSLKGTGGLSTAGVYRLVRHPIYSGTVAVELGLILSTQALISLLYLPISISLYLLMTVFEEKDLIARYGNDYLEYMKKTRKRIIPFIL